MYTKIHIYIFKLSDATYLSAQDRLWWIRLSALPAVCGAPVSWVRVTNHYHLLEARHLVSWIRLRIL